MTLAKAISEDRISERWRGSSDWKISKARPSETHIHTEQRIDQNKVSVLGISERSVV